MYVIDGDMTDHLDIRFSNIISFPILSY